MVITNALNTKIERFEMRTMSYPKYLYIGRVTSMKLAKENILYFQTAIHNSLFMNLEVLVVPREHFLEVG